MELTGVGVSTPVAARLLGASTAITRRDRVARRCPGWRERSSRQRGALARRCFGCRSGTAVPGGDSRRCADHGKVLNG